MEDVQAGLAGCQRMMQRMVAELEEVEGTHLAKLRAETSAAFDQLKASIGDIREERVDDDGRRGDARAEEVRGCERLRSLPGLQALSRRRM